MKKYRKHSIVVILILSAIITPPDVFSQLLVSIPLFFLYEVSIHISKRVVQKKERDYQEFMNDNDPGETVETTS